ncbi:Glycosyltransferase, catalytic subunit of cellulose synthase and poly-beta-1,6-N-acetylglucosamine synthase [Dyadobacter sp. SG02]|uniref:glycosyltransferase family 2 protein n=1 Tax=Dyadobacter sp. SG02 TaxID=1855291 RepID=UPI0008C3ABA8|nr:cellulose synthase catalytic subunit [Dyadobacter sp. SG02]SEI68552.1 Glycosyltransferase, catalytic subunit of cellulose synthase and poly-beta-1,6-N-acetylglucosamine synthase [Dyadobacter sp. SG02]
MKQALYVKPPTRKQLLMLRLMIFFGLISMGFFLSSILSEKVRGYAPLYWMLVVTFIFTCLKVLHEWYHYLFITVPPTPPLTRRYTVDIFTTFCAGEPYEMIVGTLTAIQAITYPHETYLCDEADDPYLRDVCAQLGVYHVTRTDKRNAKAGNINNALSISKGELCVVLDPDHVPFPDFLDPIVSHFDNPEIGYVQIVQAYKNSDEGLIAKGAAQQTYQFYGPMMMTMNHYGTVLAIGANCTFRRTALDSIGGHAAGLAEDMHTSMQLHAKGWKSVYVPAVLARGLVPSTLSAYYKQQLKWSRGVFDLFVHVYPKLFPKFTWSQRIHYGTIPLHYLSGFIFLINFLIPILALVLDVSPMHFDLTDFLLVSLPMVSCIVLIRHFVQWWVMEDEERGFHVVGGLLMIGTWWIFILGVLYTISGKKIPYVPTPKDGNEANNWPLNIPNLAVLGISLLAIVYGLYQDLNPYNLIMAGFAGLNCFFMCFNIAASRQQQIRELSGTSPFADSAFRAIKELKGNFWILRRRIYSGVRTSAFLITVLLISVIVYFRRFDPALEYNLAIAKENQIYALSLIKREPPRHPDLPALFRTMGVREPDTNGTSTQKPTVFFGGTQGVNYTKGHNWARRHPAFTKQELEADLAGMRRAGINAIRHFGPGIYDYNILRATRKAGIKVHYTFWVPETLDFTNDAGGADDLADDISATVSRLQYQKHIVSWNIGNAAIQRHRRSEHTAEQKQYLYWLKKVSEAIKRIDGSRPVTADLELNAETQELAYLITQVAPAIDAFGLVLTDSGKKPEDTALRALKVPFYFSYIGAGALAGTQVHQAGVFISNWQDEKIFEQVSFDGLHDYTGRPKHSLQILESIWAGQKAPMPVTQFKILKPALGTFEGSVLDYHAIVQQNGQWKVLGAPTNGTGLEWKLARTDGFNNPVEMNDVGTGARLTLTIPKHPSLYHLYLYVIRNGTVTEIVESQLNTPLTPAQMGAAR